MKKWLRPAATATALLLPICMARAADPAPQPLTLVKDGRPTSVIVVPAAPNEAAVFGAKELQWHLKKITGADVPIVNDRETVEAGKVQVMVGESRATRALGLTTQGYKPQEYSLTRKGQAIVLMGLDYPQYPAEASSKPTVWPNGRFGTAWDNWASVGIRDHGFTDAQGTMEAFVYVAKATNENTTGWRIFRVGDDNNGHNVDTRSDETSEKRFLVYQTFVDGKATAIEVRDAWRKREPGWHHIMMTWDAAANRAEVFLDGKSVGAAPYAKTSCEKAPFFSVRGDPGNVPQCFGPIDEVRVSRVVRKPVVPTKAYETDDDTLILLHFDDPNHMARDDSEFPRISPKEPQNHSGTLYAVYDFLEKSCGVRWYAPSEEGMVYPEAKTFAVTVKDLRRAPALEFRSCSAAIRGWGWVAGECSGEDMKTQSRRLKLGGKNLFIQHSFEGFPDMYWAKNPACPDVFVGSRPDFFELQPDGSRNPRQMCWSSTGLVAQVIADARKYFSGGGGPHRGVAGEDYYVVAPRDDQSDRCQCPDCKKAVAAGGPETTLFSSGNASELVYGFLNKVQEAVTETHPGKHIACFNYMDYTFYPKTITVNTNLYVGQALGAGWTLPEDRKGCMKLYGEWRDKMPRGNVICLWSYECFPWETGDNQGYKVFPDWNSHLIARDTKMFVDDGVRGMFQCGITPYIDGYLTVKLMDDPTINIDKELDHFFASFYGAAAEPMKEMYLYLEQIYTNPSNYPPAVVAGLTPKVEDELMSWYWLGRPERMERLGKFLDDARAKADTDMARKRVAAYERDIWAYMQEGYRTYLAKQPGGKHPYPFSPNAGKFVAQKRDAVPEVPFLTSVFFRDSANGLGVLETGFDDRQGTMEGWVWCGEAISSFCQGPGTLFEVRSYKPESGHRVSVKVDVKQGLFIAKYETWMGSLTNVITGKPMTAKAWHHLAATWDEKTSAMNLYADAGAPGKAPYRATSCAAASFDIGYAAFGPVDEVRLSKVVREPAPQRAPYATDADTLLLLHFDEEPGMPIADSR